MYAKPPLTDHRMADNNISGPDGETGHESNHYPYFETDAARKPDTPLAVGDKDCDFLNGIRARKERRFEDDRKLGTSTH